MAGPRRVAYCPGMTSKKFRIRRRRFVRDAAAFAALAVPALALPLAVPRTARAETRMLVPTIDNHGDQVSLGARYFLDDHSARYRLGVGASHPAFRKTDIQLALDGVDPVDPPVEFIGDLGPSRVRVGRVLAKGFVIDGAKQFWGDSVTMNVTLTRAAFRRLGKLYFFYSISGGTDYQGHDMWHVGQAEAVDTTFL